MKPTKKQYAEWGRKGGLTPKRRHGGGWPKGVRQHRLGIPEREYLILLADVQASVREPERGVRSIRELARHCGVSEKSVRRWLSGRCWPTSDKVRRLVAWVNRFSRANQPSD